MALTVRGVPAVRFLLALICFSGLIAADAAPYQLLIPRPGYVPVYIREGDTPLEEINPQLAEAFNEIEVSNWMLENAPDMNVWKSAESTDVENSEESDREKFDAEKSDTRKLDTEKSEADKSDAEKSHAEKSDADKPDAEKSDAEKSEADKSEAEKLEAEKSHDGKTETSKSDAEKSDAEKSDAEKLEAKKSDAEKSDTLDQLMVETAQADTVVKIEEGDKRSSTAASRPENQSDVADEESALPATVLETKKINDKESDIASFDVVKMADKVEEIN